MSKTSPFLIASGAFGRGRPAAPAAANDDCKKSRRVMSMSLPHRSRSRSSRDSQTSWDVMSSSHVTSRPVYAALRAIMHESADSAPLSAWLWKVPVVGLSLTPLLLSGGEEAVLG